MLKDKGITNIVPVGVTSHNGVLFTSVSAALRGFNVVVPVDGMAGSVSCNLVLIGINVVDVLYACGSWVLRLFD